MTRLKKYIVRGKRKREREIYNKYIHEYVNLAEQLKITRSDIENKLKIKLFKKNDLYGVFILTNKWANYCIKY